MKRQINKKVAVCILARDCDSALKRNIPQIEKLTAFFSDSKIIVIENDSIDGTKETLAHWAVINRNVTVISEDTNQVTIPPKIDSGKNPTTSFFRINKMAHFRNKYLRFIKDSNIVADYVIVIDIDLDKIYPQKIFSAITNAPNDWSAIFANGLLYTFLPCVTKYYDNYAYVPYDSAKDSFKYKERHLNVDKLNYALKKNDYVKVRSAFGGIGIYKYEALCDAKYQALPSLSGEDEALCEHVSVNLAVSNYGKLYVSKKMKALYKKLKLTPYILFSNTFYVSLWEKKKKRTFSWK